MSGCLQEGGGRCVRRGRETLRRLRLQSLSGDSQLLVVGCALGRGAGLKRLVIREGTTSLRRGHVGKRACGTWRS